MKNDIIKNEFSELKKYTTTAPKNYTDKFFEKSLLLNIETKKVCRNNLRYNGTNVYVNISITNTFSKKTEKYRILMFRLKNNDDLRVKKYNYDLLNEFLNMILCKNRMVLILFLFKHIKRIKKIPNKDYSLYSFIILLAVIMFLAIIASIYIAKLRHEYFNMLLINNGDFITFEKMSRAFIGGGCYLYLFSGGS